MKHTPRKRFGQNFLQDKFIINQILTVLNLHQNEKVIEIGAGLGSLTQPLLQKLTQLTAIEIDRDLKHKLQCLPLAENKLNLVTADALTVDYSQWGGALRIVGNLPYNIGTTLLFHLLKYVDYIQDMHFMLQKEVVNRMSAKTSTKAYGRLSVILQYYCEVESLFDVPPEAFFPKPKVDSAIVRLKPHRILPHTTQDIKILERLLLQSFSMRRKTLANNLKNQISAIELNNLGINPSARPEEIGVKEFVAIAEFIRQHKKDLFPLNNDNDIEQYK